MRDWRPSDWDIERVITNLKRGGFDVSRIEDGLRTMQRRGEEQTGDQEADEETVMVGEAIELEKHKRGQQHGGRYQRFTEDD